MYTAAPAQEKEVTKAFGTALAAIAFTSYINPIVPIAGQLSCAVHVCSKALLACLRSPASLLCSAQSQRRVSFAGEDDDKAALKTNGAGGTKLGKHKLKEDGTDTVSPKKKGRK